MVDFPTTEYLSRIMVITREKERLLFSHFKFNLKLELERTPTPNLFFKT